jgi:hypothetical protein
LFGNELPRDYPDGEHPLPDEDHALRRRAADNEQIRQYVVTIFGRIGRHLALTIADESASFVQTNQFRADAAGPDSARPPGDEGHPVPAV